MKDQGAQRRLAAILVADVVGYSRLAGVDEEGIIARLRALRSKLIDPAVQRNHGRIVKTTGDGVLIEFLSVVDAVRCALIVQRDMAQRNAHVPADRRIEFRVGINLGDVVVEHGDILGDGVNIAARLEAIAEPGGICLSEDAWRQVRDKVKEEFVDLGAQTLKNIARPVRAFRIALAASPRQAAADAPKPPLPLPDKPSIAVLPFENMSGDPEQGYFAEGMAEDIITGLSRINWLFVIARNSSFVYKGRTVDIKQVGRELGVRYVLEGSVRKAGNRVRITGQLIEADSGAHIWADRYDGALEDVFDLQDKITEAIVGIVEPRLRRAEIERARRKRPESLDAYDLYLQAVPYFSTAMPHDAEIGMTLLEKALAREPHYAAAHACISWGLEMRVVRGSFDRADADAGIRHARAALAYGGDDATALSIAALPLLHLAHDFEAASGAIARALALNNSCAVAFYFGAHIHAISGDAALAETYATRALRLSPFDQMTYAAHTALGLVRLRAGRYGDAATAFSNGVQANPGFSTLYAMQDRARAFRTAR